MNTKLPPEVLSRKQMLFGVSLFEGVDDEAFTLLASLASESHFKAGHVIVTRGDPGNKLFVIVKGLVRVLRPARKEEVEVAKVRAGDFFGEMCILERLPRSATVQAVEDTHLLLLSHAAFEILFDKMPLQHHCVLSNMARALSARLRDLGDFLALRG